MSSAVVSTSAALGRPFLFDDESEQEVHPSSAGKKNPGQSLITPVSQSTINNQQSIISHLGNRQLAIENWILPASRLGIRPTPEMATSGIPALDALTGGFPRGCLTEICGPASSGRTSVMLAALASATRRGEYCALIDASDALDPHSLAVTGIDLDRLLWVRCDEDSPRRHPSTSLRAGFGTETKNGRKEFIANNGLGQVSVRKSTAKNETVGLNTIGKGTAFAAETQFYLQNSNEAAQTRKNFEHRLEQVLRATDLLLESGGFGLIILDLADVPYQSARRIPLTTWFRFRRAIEHKPTILLAIAQQPIAGSCSSLLLQLEVLSSQFPVLSAKNDAAQRVWSAHTELLTKLEIQVELVRSRLGRKPARSIAFAAKTAWAS